MILLFSDWVLSKSQGGLLGYQYDNLTRELVVQGDLPEGWTWDILVSANGNSDTWPLALGDGQASITLTDDNLSVRGEYYLQLRGTNGDQVRHTNVITAYNSRSLSGAGQWPTLPTEWIQAEKDIKELNAHPPVPGSNGYWLLWDLSSHSYQESDLPVPVGPAGPPNVLEIGTVETLPADQPATASITGESPAQKLNLGIPRGQTGKTGATPALEIGQVETLEPGQPATAEFSGTPEKPVLSLGIPRGPTGKTGATPALEIGQVETLEPGEPATAELTGTPEAPVLSLGIPQGPPGKDGVQLNDNAVNTTKAWSSKKIVDTLCPEFSVSGNPVTCHPVEGYPLSAVVSLKPKQAGTGDPSPENVRPISGYDSVTVTQSKDEAQVKQITLTLPETIYGGTVDSVTGEGEKARKCIEFDGTESWFTWGPNSGADGVTGFYHYRSIDGDPAEPRIISSILLFNPDAYGGTEVGCALGDLGNVNPYIIFSISNSILSDVSSNQAAIDSWKSYLSAQASAGTPVQVAYKLATPTSFQATGNQPLPAVAGLNTVYTDGDSLDVSGRQDLLYTLQTMQAQTQNLNRFIAEGGTT